MEEGATPATECPRCRVAESEQVLDALAGPVRLPPAPASGFLGFLAIARERRARERAAARVAEAHPAEHALALRQELRAIVVATEGEAPPFGATMVA